MKTHAVSGYKTFFRKKNVKTLNFARIFVADHREVVLGFHWAQAARWGHPVHDDRYQGADEPRVGRHHWGRAGYHLPGVKKVVCDVE